MRMWLVNPIFMCNKHLCGEYHELFMIVGTLKRKKNIDGFIKNNCIEVKSLKKRYKELKQEMLKRGFKPKAKLIINSAMFAYLKPAIRNYKIDKMQALSELIRRCPKCTELYFEKKREI